MLFWGWLAYSGACGAYVGCGILGSERDTFIVIGVLYGMPLDLVGTVHVARNLSRGTFQFKCTYSVQDIGRQQPLCTH